MTAAAIVMNHLSRQFGAVTALDDLTLTVPAGTIFGFLGPNGAGKTTTIRLLLGLLEPTHGSATVLGFDSCVQGDEIRARTGALLEHPGIYEQLTAEENLIFYSRIYGLDGAARDARIKALLTRIGLWDRRHERAGDWSRGMRQKLALARVLLHRPPLVLLDEPTAGLDVVAANDVRSDLERLAADEGVTIFLTTHNMAEAERLCRQVSVIRDGRLIAHGDPNALRAQVGRGRIEVIGRNFTDAALTQLRTVPAVASAAAHNGHLDITLREPTASAPLVSLLVGAGVEIDEVRRDDATLEDVFLTLMEEE